MSQVAVAYIPVLHEGYRRFVDAHARGRELFVVGPSLYADYRPLAKDIRCLDASLVASAIDAWGIASGVEVLDEAGAGALAARAPAITLPAEDVSYQLVERWFAHCEVRYDTVFLRWDKSRSVQLVAPRPARRISPGDALDELALEADRAAAGSADWWRRVGAAIRFEDGTIASANNVHNPHPLSPYVAGDPRSGFSSGVGYEISTATHAEAGLIANAARDGIPTAGAVMYVTDFPCPPCAKLIAGAGIARLYYRTGYSVLDGQDVLESAGVEIVQVQA
jgi:dCMP deaminase